MLKGEDALVRYRTDTDATRTFCGKCGSTVFYEGPRWPDEIHVAAACLDAVDREPQANVYVDHKAEWWTFHDELPQLGGPTGMEPKKH